MLCDQMESLEKKKPIIGLRPELSELKPGYIYVV